jgi:hypothetical protein
MKRNLVAVLLSLVSIHLLAQSYVVKGMVLNAETGEPMEYAVVQLLRNDSL